MKLIQPVITMTQEERDMIQAGTRENTKAPEAVDHPKHYNALPGGIECIDVVENMSFNLGNAVKYIWRCGEKGKMGEDLRKAIWYLEREIKLASERVAEENSYGTHV